MKCSLRSSTALVAALAMSLQPILPAHAQIAADGTDCALSENAEAAACVELRNGVAPTPEVAPVLEATPEPAPEAEPVSEAGQETAPANTAESEPAPEPEAAPEPAPQVESAPETEPVLEASPEPAPEVAPVLEATPEPAPEAGPVPDAGQETAPANTAESEPAPETEPAPEPTPQQDSAPEPEPVLELAPEPEPATETVPEPTPQVEAAPEATEQPAETAPTPVIEESVVAPLSAPEADPIPAVEAVLPDDAVPPPEPIVAPADAASVTGTGAAAEALRAAVSAPVTSVDVEAPPAIVPDAITAADRQRLNAQEQARREEARNRRDVLLGALAVGAAVGVLIPALGGTVVEDQGDRLIVEQNGNYFVRKDESALLRDGDAEFRVQRLPRGETLETVIRRNGVQIVTVRDAGGQIISRSRILPDGTEIVLIDNTLVPFDGIDLTRFPPPPPGYLVSAGRSDRDVIYRTFLAPPAYAPPRAFTLEEVRQNRSVRDLVARVDLDSVTFDSGSAFVTQSQIRFIADTAAAAKALITQDPSAIVLVEGHTDAVGSESSNLVLSDRRAETVARILVEAFGVPAENLIVQGYGEQFLKVNTEGAERANRRVTLRNISALVASGN